MSLGMPFVRKSQDLMEAYMMVPSCNPDENYTVDYLNEILTSVYDIKLGVIQTALEKIVESRLFDREVLVAKGELPKDGKDGYYEFLFNRTFSQQPIVLEDGSVDYRNIKMIEVVEAGQDIAIYHPPTQGTNGYNLGAQFQNAKRGVELPPLRGTGFECLDDGVTYRATVSGKITEINNRVNIFPVHELFGDVDLSTGNIEFNGDVIIHGNVLDGMSVRATGTITVDKLVEAAYIEGRKGVILHGGVLGKNNATICSKGNITAQFFEYARVECEGNIEAESFMDSRVYCGGHIHVSGKKGCIIGGETHAVCGISATQIGNEAGTNTTVTVGVHPEVYAKNAALQAAIDENTGYLEKIEEGLLQFEQAMRTKGTSFRNDPRRMTLVKEKVRLTALIAGHREEMAKNQKIIEASTSACVEAIRMIYPGVRIGVDEQSIQVKEEQQSVEFRKYMGRIGMFGIGYTVA
ncbi:MAG: FapA family protein [bacterium]|nr:FapA family protein [bacterium]